MSFTRYDKRTGAIISVDSHLLPNEPDYVGTIKGAWDPAEYWIRRRRVVPLSPMPIEVSGRTLTGVPEKSVITFQGEKIRASGAWTAPGLGADYVLVECPGYKRFWSRLAGSVALRADAYPPIGDQLDAIARGFAALADAGLPLPAETLAWLDMLRAVKALHPRD